MEITIKNDPSLYDAIKSMDLNKVFHMYKDNTNDDELIEALSKDAHIETKAIIRRFDFFISGLHEEKYEFSYFLEEKKL